jgi:hypothetical protein
VHELHSLHYPRSSWRHCWSAGTAGRASTIQEKCGKGLDLGSMDQVRRNFQPPLAHAFTPHRRPNALAPDALDASRVAQPGLKFHFRKGGVEEHMNLCVPPFPPMWTQRDHSIQPKYTPIGFIERGSVTVKVPLGLIWNWSLGERLNARILHSHK